MGSGMKPHIASGPRREMGASGEHQRCPACEPEGRESQPGQSPMALLPPQVPALDLTPRQQGSSRLWAQRHLEGARGSSARSTVPGSPGQTPARPRAPAQPPPAPRTNRVPTFQATGVGPALAAGVLAGLQAGAPHRAGSATHTGPGGCSSRRTELWARGREVTLRRARRLVGGPRRRELPQKDSLGPPPHPDPCPSPESCSKATAVLCASLDVACGVAQAYKTHGSRGGKQLASWGCPPRGARALGAGEGRPCSFPASPLSAQLS